MFQQFLAQHPTPEASPVDVPQRVQVVDVAFDNLTRAQALARIQHMLLMPHAAGDRTHTVFFVNPACVNIAVHHPDYRRVLTQADLVLPDGSGMRLACRWLGTPMRENLNGTDFFAPLCELLQQCEARVFLLGAQPGVAQEVAQSISRQWPALKVAGWHHGFFKTHEEADVVRRIRDSGAQVVLVAQGVPLQELFIARHATDLGAQVALGVGALFDFVAHKVPRAPLWMRRLGLEWVYRLWQEPARLWKRYILGNPVFLARVGCQGLQQRVSRLLQARQRR